MDLFRPFIARNELLASFSWNQGRPEMIFALSLSHLRNLTQFYYDSFKGTAELHTVSWIHGPLYVAPGILRYENNETKKTSFICCMHTLAGLIESHPTLKGFLKALLGMAVSAKVFTVSEAMEYYKVFTTSSERYQDAAVVETGFVVDQDLAIDRQELAVGDALAAKFDDLFIAGQCNQH